MCTMSIILKLLKEQNKTQIQLCKELGIGKQTFTNWKSGASSSYIKYLPQLARFFNVSVDYLLDYTADGSDEDIEKYVIFHRNGKQVKVKFTPDQRKVFDALVASAETD